MVWLHNPQICWRALVKPSLYVGNLLWPMPIDYLILVSIDRRVGVEFSCLIGFVTLVIFLVS